MLSFGTNHPVVERAVLSLALLRWHQKQEERWCSQVLCKLWFLPWIHADHPGKAFACSLTLSPMLASWWVGTQVPFEWWNWRSLGSFYNNFPGMPAAHFYETKPWVTNTNNSDLRFNKWLLFGNGTPWCLLSLLKINFFFFFQVRTWSREHGD